MISLRDNVEAYERYRILPRVLRNVESVDTSTTFLGHKVTFPLGISPSAMHKLAHPDGELATSRAAATLNVGMCLSSYATTSLEDVAKQGCGNPYMMQMCVLKDRSKTKQLLDRAEADVPVLGRRLNEFRNDFTLPKGLSFPNILSTGDNEFAKSASSQDYGRSQVGADIAFAN
ncbi:hypothetical protein H2204_008831 [Knufia peltigerae]|uniref:FMN hydroxy acid dehydrogenase domain-containing protein n=1 Tax=Knufia peltigerae TaxID=1002370 RepID=A0AA38XZF1_9EURO|nr:hypothetical protein H2204_008831 [Knufia peltigerae]